MLVRILRQKLMMPGVVRKTGLLSQFHSRTRMNNFKFGLDTYEQHHPFSAKFSSLSQLPGLE